MKVTYYDEMSEFNLNNQELRNFLYQRAIDRINKRFKTIAVKHCPRDHHDYEELMKLLDEMDYLESKK